MPLALIAVGFIACGGLYTVGLAGSPGTSHAVGPGIARPQPCEGAPLVVRNPAIFHASFASLPPSTATRLTPQMSPSPPAFQSPPFPSTPLAKDNGYESGLRIWRESLHSRASGGVASCPAPMGSGSPTSPKDTSVLRLCSLTKDSPPDTAVMAPLSGGPSPLPPRPPLPTLCPSLVLPTRESHLEVPLATLEGLMASSDYGEFHVLGPLGNKLMRAAVSEGNGGRALDVFMVQPPGGHILRIASAERQEAASREILTPDGSLWGTITHDGEASFSVTSGSQPLLLIRRDLAGGDGFQWLTAVAAQDQRPLASASPAPPRRGGERVQFRMQRGVDTALVFSCMMAVLLLFRSDKRDF